MSDCVTFSGSLKAGDGLRERMPVSPKPETRVGGATGHERAGVPLWIVSWLPVTGSIVRGRFIPAPREIRKFEDQDSAVGFVMKLDEEQRATAQMSMPRGATLSFR
jgi:hypothetical protein